MVFKEDYLSCLGKIQDSYDAFYFENIGEPTTHKDEFAALNDFVGKCGDETAKHAMSWISDQYDCAYKDECSGEDGPFFYLRSLIERLAVSSKENK